MTIPAHVWRRLSDAARFGVVHSCVAEGRLLRCVFRHFGGAA